MKTYLLFIVLLSILFAGCDYIFTPTPRYDPQKAGAAIVESYDITNQIRYGQWLTYYDLASYDDKIYIHIDGLIYVFSKEKFLKIREIKINFLDKTNKFYSKNNGLVVIDDDHGLLLCQASNVYDRCYLFSLNLETGEAVPVESFDEIIDITSNEFNIPDNGVIRNMGYDKTNNFFWFASSYGSIFFFRYNLSNGTFTLEKSMEKIKNDMRSPPSIYIDGDNLFYTGYNVKTDKYKTIEPYIEKYRIADAPELLHTIFVEYLGTGSSPEHIIYDPPYIWIMVERDNQIQMLKLLPHG